MERGEPERNMGKRVPWNSLSEERAPMCGGVGALKSSERSHTKVYAPIGVQL